MALRRGARDVGDLVGLALWRWGRVRPGRLRWVARRTLSLGVAELTRVLRQPGTGGRIPRVVAVSPTMACNYDCGGCYSRGRSEKDELSTGELDSLFAEAESLGVLSVVVTGGEPLLRDDLLGIIARHQRLLFVVITNGSRVTEDAARRIASCGNAIPLVSIEGFPEDTDGRRRDGAHETATKALQRFADAGACFGFAAMVTARNMDHVICDEFIDGMEAMGCSVGFLTEYVPTDINPREDWLLSEEMRSEFRKRVLDQRRRRCAVLVQFPYDEYGPDNRCTGAGRASLHIGSRGEVEPCPFMAVSCDNIRDGGLAAACGSSFLRSIRERPELLQRERLGCSLFEHREEVERLADDVRSGGQGNR